MAEVKFNEWRKFVKIVHIKLKLVNDYFKNLDCNNNCFVILNFVINNLFVVYYNTIISNYLLGYTKINVSYFLQEKPLENQHNY